ncbi:MAG: threonine ammonia-lyase [Methanomicrobiaceae archaeon]|nr:threonine ammonia-lyase [Methanomicrobiaceae archaeon]
MVTVRAIREAASVLEGRIIKTPLVYSPSFSEMTGVEVYLKLENLQKAGSFKVRGATVKIHSLQDTIGNAGVVAASAGNHAQGVAVAAEEIGIPSTIVMPEFVSVSKEQATRGYGAEVIIHGKTLAESITHALTLAEEEGMTFIHPYDDPAVIAGQGTIGLEIIEDLPDVDAVIVPVGGGGLISGIAVAASEAGIRILGAEAAACPAASAARKAGGPVTVEADYSVADGIAVTRVGDLPFSLMEEWVEAIAVVEEEMITRAMRILLSRKKQIAEGAGVVGLAALHTGRLPIPAGSSVAVVISGGNVDIPLLARIIRKGLALEGRIMRCRVKIEDRPGTLAGLLEVVARERGNILDIHHIRPDPQLPLNFVQVELEIETRSLAHARVITGAIEDAGYRLVSEP